MRISHDLDLGDHAEPMEVPLLRGLESVPASDSVYAMRDLEP